MKINRTIEPIVNDGLCTGCGTCVGLCPRDAIKLVIDKTKGLYIPQLDRGRCSECGICFEVCPGHSVDFTALNQDIFGKQPEDVVLGNYLNCYLGHATDYEIRYNSASGGLVTTLLIFALEEGLIDGALVTRMNREKPLEPEQFIARTREEIISAARSKYCPVPANIALKEILKEEGKFAVVGLPCHIHGIRKAEVVNKKLKEKIALHLGVLCGHTDSFRETEFILKKYAINKEQVVQLDYRGKGWPGAMTIHLRKGGIKSIPYEEYIYLHGLRLFTPWRCNLCADSISRLADITFMDAWLPEIMAQDKTGKSIIVSRTGVGERLCQNAKLKRIAELEKIDSDRVSQSQGKMALSNKDLEAFFNLSRLFRHSIPNYNMQLPCSGPVNYLRALVTYFNMWVSSRSYTQKFINPLLWLETRILRQVKSRM